MSELKTVQLNLKNETTQLDSKSKSTSTNKSSVPPASLVPVQPTALTSRDKTTQRLIVVLSQACLETYKMNSGDQVVIDLPC